jgi:phospholipase/carboxylesterase
VPIATDTELITFQDWTLRVRSSKNPKRLLLLIHGWTGDENSMWVFARDLPADYWIIAPRGPHAAEPGGFSWRPPQPGTHGRPSLEMLKPAADRLIAFVDAYSSTVGVDASQFDVMGFSQGAAMSNVLALLHPERIHKAGILAGFVPSGLEEIIARRPLVDKPFFVAHGIQDEMVPIDRARASIELLEQAGARVTYCEDEVGHKVSANCMRALKEFFSDPTRPADTLPKSFGFGGT